MKTKVHPPFRVLSLAVAAFPCLLSCGSSEPGGAPNGGGTAPSFAGGGNPATAGQASGAGGVTAGSGGQLGAAGMTAGTGGNSGGSGGKTGAGGMSGSGTSGGGGSDGPAPSGGCNKAAGLMSGRASIDVGGTMREYILAVPDDYDQTKPYKLIFGWHPWGGSAQQVAGGGYYGLDKEADGEAIFVSPEGLPFGGNGLGWGNTDGQDVEFLGAMLELFRSQLCIDDGRIFSTGFSFGGMMSFAAGCSSTSMMRAIAPMAGNIMVAGCENGTRPVAVMGFHGDHDGVVELMGGQAGRDVFVKRNGCTMETKPAEPSWCSGIAQNFQPCSCVEYQGCTAGYPVIWCEYNADHMPAPSSGATLWNFFSQF